MAIDIMDHLSDGYHSTDVAEVNVAQMLVSQTANDHGLCNSCQRNGIVPILRILIRRYPIRLFPFSRRAFASLCHSAK